MPCLSAHVVMVVMREGWAELNWLSRIEQSTVKAILQAVSVCLNLILILVLTLTLTLTWKVSEWAEAGLKMKKKEEDEEVLLSEMRCWSWGQRSKEYSEMSKLFKESEMRGLDAATQITDSSSSIFNPQSSATAITESKSSQLLLSSLLLHNNEVQWSQFNLSLSLHFCSTLSKFKIEIEVEVEVEVKGLRLRAWEREEERRLNWLWL